MIPVYYKYTNLSDIKQIKNYKIRISSPLTLNDPFEAQFNSEVVDKISKNLTLGDFGMKSIEGKFTPDKEENILKNKIKSFIEKYGVVSLSETPRNLLMWAHYANEHRGICIGLKHDFFESKKQLKHVTKYKIESYLPLKVNYDSCRPQNIEDDIDITKEIKSQIRNQMLTKSNDWMYEKEYRCIIPLSWADEVKLLNEDLYEDLVKYTIDCGLVYEKEKNTYAGDALSSFANMFFLEKDAVFLKDVNIESIDSIYLGCKMNQGDKEWLVNEVCKKQSELNHIKLYEVSLSQSKFELDFNLLNPQRGNSNTQKQCSLIK